MSNPLVDGKTFEEIIKQPYEMVTSLWLSSSSSGILNSEQIKEIINTFGILENLITFHINKSKDNNLITFLLNYFSNNHKAFLKYFKYFTKPVQDLILASIRNKELILDKDCYIYTLRIISKNYNDITDYVRLIKEFNTLIIDTLDTEQEYFSFENSDLTILYTEWLLTHLYKRNDISILNFIEEYSGIKYKSLEDTKYIIAYKGVNTDGTSVIASRCTYDVGQIYEENSDNDWNTENSFGLSVWDIEHAKTYGKLVLTCKIEFKDITYFDLLDGKLRCSKFTILHSNQYD